MPDSLPPPASWGIPSYDERDLDALLSGEAMEIPMALRPLADALTALKGSPTPVELRGETAAMAEFRALTTSGTLMPAPAPGHAETLELPTLRPDSRSRRTARHRVRRPARRRLSAFLVAAAAAGIVGAVALTGNLPGPFQHLAGLSKATPSAASPAARPTSPKLQDRSASSVPAVPHRHQTARPSPSSSPSASASPNGSALCRDFFRHFEHPVNGQQWWKWPGYDQLSAAADGPDHIIDFCQPYLQDMFPHGMPGNLPGFLGTGQSGQQGFDQGASSSGQGSIGGSTAHYPVGQAG